MTMSLDGPYEDENIFARIVRGEIPSAKVFEDDRVLAIMDAFPQSRGHALVISKQSRARNLLDVEDDVLAEMILAVQRLARAVNTALAPDGIKVIQFNGAPAGQSVFHLHFHVIPGWESQPLGAHGGGMADPAELRALAEAIAPRLDEPA
jgi:histidine triad (HIT) family protein